MASSLGRGADWRRGVTTVSVACVLLAAAADFLFYHHPIGFTPAIFGALLLLAIGVRSTRFLRGSAGRVVLVLTLGLLVSFVLESGWLALWLSISGIISLAMIDRATWTSRVREWMARWMGFFLVGWAVLIHDPMVARRWRARRGREPSPIGRAAAGWLATTALTLVFVGLFAAANPVVSWGTGRAFSSFGDFFTRFSEIVEASRVGLWMLVFVLAWMTLRVRPTRARPLAPPRLASVERMDRLASPGHVVRCLVLFNAVFAVQLGLDALYLLGGARLPDGLTYAQYAHRGAYPLVATTILAAAFVLVTFRAGAPAEKFRAARGLVYMWLAQNVALIATAAWRLGMYVDAYSLTRWRVAAGVWMVVVGLGVVWILWRIVAGRSNQWLVRASVLTALAALYACAFVNIDEQIAWYNVRHCREIRGGGGPEQDGGATKIDQEYLVHLGVPALPALRWLGEHAQDPATQRAAAENAGTLRTRLDVQMSNWRGWTVARARMMKE